MTNASSVKASMQGRGPGFGVNAALALNATVPFRYALRPIATAEIAIFASDLPAGQLSPAGLNAAASIDHVDSSTASGPSSPMDVVALMVIVFAAVLCFTRPAVFVLLGRRAPQTRSGQPKAMDREAGDWCHRAREFHPSVGPNRKVLLSRVGTNPAWPSPSPRRLQPCRHHKIHPAPHCVQRSASRMPPAVVAAPCSCASSAVSGSNRCRHALHHTISRTLAATA